MTRTRTLLTLLVVALVVPLLGHPGVAGADDARARRDAARQRRAQLAAQLDEIKASEQELLDAARALGDQVLAQAARVDAARRAVAAAEREAADAAAAVAETKTQIDEIGRALVRRAIQAYMDPRHDDAMGATSDFNDDARRKALLDSVSANDDDLIDQLDAAREDFELQQRAAEEARERATARRAETEKRLAELEAAEREQRRLKAAVDARAREVLAEIDAQARVESELSRLIRQREEEVRRQRGGAPSGARNAGGCIWPARGRVTSEYGSRWGRQHQGIDIGAPTGTAIWAAKDGVVIFAGRQSGYGNVVIIDHGNMTTLYGHQSRIAVGDGESVSQGDVIGAVGSTGRSTGPHLHFETRYGGSPRNPRSCLP